MSDAPRSPIDIALAFLRSEAAGGVFLILASAAALIWSNSPYAAGYVRLVAAPLGLGLSVHDAVNDGLMSLFFLLAGLEIRREMTEGHLASLPAMAAPGIAALGGMLAPAAIYLALNHANAAAMRGWAVPVATDIAFSLAVLRVLGGSVGSAPIVFLTALAILDDLGAILVIALFYTQDVHWPLLGAAAALWVGLWALNRARVRRLWPYLLGGAALWALVFHSGVHATLAGVALAFAVPSAGGAAERLERWLCNVVAYAILPVFGLVNAGLDLSAIHPGILLTGAPLGVLLGLCLGKQAGVFGATMLGRACGVLRLPEGMSVRQLYGVSLLCGIGFTMSLFIGDLAFGGGALHAGTKLAVLCASVASAGAGVAVVRKQEVLF